MTQNTLSRRGFLGSGLAVAGGLSMGTWSTTSTTAHAESAAMPNLKLNPETLDFSGCSQAQYIYEGVPFKPYMRRLHTPSGLNILRDAPKDHPHHHALMLAMKVNGVNFWEEYTEKVGRQRHLAFNAMEVKKDCLHCQEMLDWEEPKRGRVLLKEQRETTLLGGKADSPTFLEWKSLLWNENKNVRLEGTHYHGLGMRFLESMDNEGRFLNSARTEGEIIRGDERNLCAAWCAYQAKAETKPVTVALFSHPDSFRHPSTFFTMGDASPRFAYLSATLGLYQNKEVLKRGRTSATALWRRTVGRICIA